MSIEIKNDLTDNEMLFVKRMMEEILPNEKNLDVSVAIEIGNLVGIQVTKPCCGKGIGGGQDLKNLYFKLLPSYNEKVVNNFIKEVDKVVDFEEEDKGFDIKLENPKSKKIKK